MTHPTQPDPFQQPDLWSHPDKPVIELVAVRGVCMRLRPLDAPVRPGEPCGLIHTRCAGHVRGNRPSQSQRRGDPCPQPAMKGGAVCNAHSIGPDRNAEQLVATSKAIDSCITLGLEVEVNPVDALYNELCRTEGHVQWLLAEIRKLAPDAITWGKHEHRKGEGPEGPVDIVTYRAAAPVLFDLYAEERARLVKVAAECIKAGLEERYLRLAEDAGKRDADLIRTLIDNLGLDMNTPETERAIRATFTLMQGGAAA